MGRHYRMTEEERAEARRAYRKAYYAKKREELLAAREIAKSLGCPERKRGSNAGGSASAGTTNEKSGTPLSG